MLAPAAPRYAPTSRWVASRRSTTRRDVVVAECGPPRGSQPAELVGADHRAPPGAPAARDGEAAEIPDVRAALPDQRPLRSLLARGHGSSLAGSRACSPDGLQTRFRDGTPPRRAASDRLVHDPGRGRPPRLAAPREPGLRRGAPRAHPAAHATAAKLLARLKPQLLAASLAARHHRVLRLKAYRSLRTNALALREALPSASPACRSVLAAAGRLAGEHGHPVRLAADVHRARKAITACVVPRKTPAIRWPASPSGSSPRRRLSGRSTDTPTSTRAPARTARSRSLRTRAPSARWPTAARRSSPGPAAAGREI